MTSDDPTEKALLKEFGVYVEAVGKSFSAPLQEALARQQKEMTTILDKTRAMLDHDHEKLRHTIRDADSTMRESAEDAVTSVNGVSDSLLQSAQGLNDALTVAQKSIEGSLGRHTARIGELNDTVERLEKVATIARNTSIAAALLAGIAAVLAGIRLAGF